MSYPQHQAHTRQQQQQQDPPPTDWIDGKLPPPLSGSFVGGNKPPGGGFGKFQHLDRRYDGKSLRKAVQRRTIDYQSTVIRYLQDSIYKRQALDQDFVQPEKNFLISYLPTFARSQKPMEAMATKFVHSSTNKIKCPVNVLKWTPDGRRVITGSTSGEFTLWNGLMFNFETILQAHDAAVRAMIWSHNEQWMITSDQLGIIKYWQPNMNNVNILQAHREPIRGLSFSPTDIKLSSCSDDSTIKIWDFNQAREEVLLTGHGWDVKCVTWHPFKGLLASGSKDNLVKLWDPKSGKNLSTFHGHKNTILGLEWNKNGNWLVAGSRDQLIKLYDIRMMREVQSFKGHKKEINSITWHPSQEDLFVSGGSDGSIYFWLVGETNPVASLESAHDSNVWYMDWHPLGHVLASGSNDHATRFWTRHRPEDVLNDSYINGKTDAERMGTRDFHHMKHQHHSQQQQDYTHSQPAPRPAPPSMSFAQQGNLPGLNAQIPGFQPDMFSTGGSSIPGLGGAIPDFNAYDDHSRPSSRNDHRQDRYGGGDQRHHGNEHRNDRYSNGGSGYNNNQNNGSGGHDERNSGNRRGRGGFRGGGHNYNNSNNKRF